MPVPAARYGRRKTKSVEELIRGCRGSRMVRFVATGGKDRVLERLPPARILGRLQVKAVTRIVLRCKVSGQAFRV